MSGKTFLMVALLLLLLPGVALASKDGPALNAEAGTFAAQRAEVQKNLADGETYAEISPADRASVIAVLDRMEALLSGRPVSALSEAEKVQLMNDQSQVNTILTQAGEDSRLVCRREQSAGSRLARSQCLTVAERRRQRENSQDAIDQFNRGLNSERGFNPGAR